MIYNVISQNTAMCLLMSREWWINIFLSISENTLLNSSRKTADDRRRTMTVYVYSPCSLCRSIAGHNPHNLFIFTKDYRQNFTTRWLLTTEHMAMFVVKSIVIQINSQVYRTIYVSSPQVSRQNIININTLERRDARTRTKWTTMLLCRWQNMCA